MREILHSYHFVKEVQLFTIFSTFVFLFHFVYNRIVKLNRSGGKHEEKTVSSLWLFGFLTAYFIRSIFRKMTADLAQKETENRSKQRISR